MSELEQETPARSTQSRSGPEYNQRPDTSLVSEAHTKKQEDELITLREEVSTLAAQLEQSQQRIEQLKAQFFGLKEHITYQDGQIDLLIRQMAERPQIVIERSSEEHVSELSDPEVIVIEVEFITLQRYALLSLLLISIGLYLLTNDYRIPLLVSLVSAPLVYFLKPLYTPLGKMGRLIARGVVCFFVLALLLYISSFFDQTYYVNNNTWVAMMVFSLIFTFWRERSLNALPAEQLSS